jgi:hypothetical protein
MYVETLGLYEGHISTCGIDFRRTHQRQDMSRFVAHFLERAQHMLRSETAFGTRIIVGVFFRF